MNQNILQVKLWSSRLKAQQYHRTVDPELEGTHEEHWVQLMTPRRSTKKMNHISESIVKKFFEHQQA